MFNIGPPELIVIVVLALIVLGPEKFPQAARSAARAIREIRSVTDGLTHELARSLDETDEEPQPVRLDQYRREPIPRTDEVDVQQFDARPPTVYEDDEKADETETPKPDAI